MYVEASGEGETLRSVLRQLEFERTVEDRKKRLVPDLEEEIPEEMEGLRQALPSVQLLYARTLGVEHQLLDLVVERIDAALAAARVAPTFGELGVVFVNRGSRLHIDPGAKLRQIAAELEKRLGGRAKVQPAQAEYASPTVQEASAALVADGCRIIVVVPYIFFPGKVLYDNIKPGMEQAKEQSPEVTFLMAETLGVDDRLVQVALKRAYEALEAMRD